MFICRRGRDETSKPQLNITPICYWLGWHRRTYGSRYLISCGSSQTHRMQQAKMSLIFLPGHAHWRHGGPSPLFLYHCSLKLLGLDMPKYGTSCSDERCLFVLKKRRFPEMLRARLAKRADRGSVKIRCESGSPDAVRTHGPVHCSMTW